MENKKTIVIGVTASIAAYKVLGIIKSLKSKGHNVHVIMTAHATNLVDPKDFAKASGNPVQTQLFDPSVRYQSYLAQDKPMQHISLADEANLLLICPATANVLAKVAYGFADDLLTSTIAATNASVVFTPAMNVKMWKNLATQENVKKLKANGYYFAEPEYGELACGYKGVGRLANGKKILEIVKQLLRRGSQLQRKKVIVTAGATQEPLDAVRVITNRASGKMGAAIADEALSRGAEVVLIRGKNAVSGRHHYKEIEVETADDMLFAIKEEVDDAHIIFHTAAVSDFGMENPIDKKVKSNRAWKVSLEPTMKILGVLKKLNPKIYLVAFKAEYNVSPKKLIDAAYDILSQSNANLAVANDVGKKGRGFSVDTNEVYIVDDRKKNIHLRLAPKQKIAQQLLDYVSLMI